MGDKQSSREDLESRVLPSMTLSDGSESSMTAPPAPFSKDLSATERAAKRFEVKGNIVGRTFSVFGA